MLLRDDRCCRNLFTSFRFLAPYAISFVAIVCLIAFALLPFLRSRRATNCAKLRYARWLYVDEEPNGSYNGELRIADSAAMYALDRYPKTCDGKIKPWHVFLRTNEGAPPLAVSFDRNTYIIESVRRLSHNELSGKRLRATAVCSESPIESQFRGGDDDEDDDDNNNNSNNNNVDISEQKKQRERRALRRLSKRYSYKSRLNEENELVIEFVDASTGRSYEFVVHSLRATFVNDHVRFGQQRLPDEWLLSRKSTVRPITSENAVVNDYTVAELTSGVSSYEKSPCFDPTVGKQTVGQRAIASLSEFERLYMHGIVKYPEDRRPELRDKLKRFYWDCVYRTTADRDLLLDEAVRSELFPIVTYLRICPNDRPTFDAKRAKCV